MKFTLSFTFAQGVTLRTVGVCLILAKPASGWCLSDPTQAQEESETLSQDAGRHAEAQEETTEVLNAPPAGSAPEAGYWEAGEKRGFVGSSFALGSLSSAELTLGYGRPRWIWGGLVAYALSTTEFGAIGIGPQIDLLLANALLRVRRTWSYGRRLVTPATSYDNASLSDSKQPRANYTAIDSYVWGYLPIGPTLGIWGVRGEWVPGLPQNQALFSEFLRFTLQENWAVMPRLTWWLKMLNDDLMVGIAADSVLTPDRDALFRLGAGVVYSFGPHLQAQALLTVPVVSPDTIGWFTQSWGTARLEWSWASGEAAPGFF